MGIRGLRQTASILLAVSFLFYTQPVFSAGTSVNVIGDVVGSGAAEMKTAFDRWVPVADKLYPLAEGTSLRTGKGSMSVDIKNGIRMEIGHNSNAKISSSMEVSSATLDRGIMAFSVPGKAVFSVATPNAIVQTVENIANTSGEVSYDGTGTRVTAGNGTLSVKDATGKDLQAVGAGETVYTTGTGTAAVLAGALTLVVGGTAILSRAVDNGSARTASPSSP